MYTVAWFSAGVSSAVATKLAINEIDEIIYTHIEDQHKDTLRFVVDCEEWFGKPITILRSPYRNVKTVCLMKRYINGPKGAVCTGLLKRRVRQEWEIDHSDFLPFRYVWGMDASKKERERAKLLQSNMESFEHVFPLIEKGIGKAEAHRILKASGVRRPVMYDLGYHNNNCVGCLKGGMGYFNKLRVDFPEVFSARAKLEREIGASCINGVFLDELTPARGRHKAPVVDECGIMCETIGIK